MMGFPFNSSHDRMEIIERMERHMGEGFVKRGERYLDPDWNPRDDEQALEAVLGVVRD